MFNEKIKERFLDELPTAVIKHSARKVFQWSSPGEIFLQKDIAEMSYEEAKLAFSKNEVFNLTSINNQRYITKKYIDWCRENSIFEDIKTGYYEISTPELDISEQLGAMSFRDENDLISSIQEVIPLTGWWEPAALALYWLGLDNHEVGNLRDDQVNLQDCFIVDDYDVRIVEEMSEKIASLLRAYADNDMGVRRNRGKGHAVYKNPNSEKFIKGFYVPYSEKNERELGVSEIKGCISSLNNKYVALGHPPKFSFQNVWRSGRLCKLYELETSGKLDIHNEGDVLHVFRGNSNYKNIVWIYNNYKRAFYN